MTDDATRGTSTREPSPSMRTHWMWLLVLGFFFLTGCRGCNQKVDPKQSNSEEKPIARLAFGPFGVQPASKDPAPIVLKPGHWYQASQSLKANLEDESLTLVSTLTDTKMAPYPYASGYFQLQFEKKVSLAKGQKKSSELDFFFHMPPAVINMDSTQSKRAGLRTTAFSRGMGIRLDEKTDLVNVAPAEQYAVLVVSKEPNRHSVWKGLDCMTWPSFELETWERISPHRVVSIGEEELRFQLPDHVNYWTHISHVIWYDADPGLLSDFQRDALIDWLMYGGQILFSGPDSLAAMQDSLFAPHLPLIELRTEPLPIEVMREFSKAWTVPESKGESPISTLGLTDVPFLAGRLGDNSDWLAGADQLLAERQIGRGRVGVSTISLSEDCLVKWRSFSSFVNGGLLRHSPRTWLSDERNQGFQWIDHQEEFHDGSISTQFRWLVRDGESRSIFETSRQDEKTMERVREIEATEEDVQTDREDSPDRNWELAHGVSAEPGRWNDQSVLASAALRELAARSGIRIPHATKIAALLAIYLTFLVPVNWLIFRMLGRLELAWVAVPFIAIGGAILVARSVQLDIGFSRSENRVVVLDMIAGHDRAHQSIFGGLYTSLSTNYTIRFEKERGVVLPIETQSTGNRGRLDRQEDFVMEQGGDAGDGTPKFFVASNSMKAFHAEQIVELGGPILFDLSNESEPKARMENRTSLRFQDVQIVGKDEEGNWLAGSIGTLEPGAIQSCSLIRSNRPNLFLPGTASASDGTNGQSSARTGFLNELCEIGVRQYRFAPGSMVAVGWTEEDPCALRISPRANQRQSVGLVLIDLRPSLLPVARADSSLPALELPAEASNSTLEDSPDEE